jgi:hypothetical protein
MAVHIVNYLIVHSVHQFPSAYVISDFIHCLQSIQNHRDYCSRNLPTWSKPTVLIWEMVVLQLFHNVYVYCYWTCQIFTVPNICNVQCSRRNSWRGSLKFNRKSCSLHKFLCFYLPLSFLLFFPTLHMFLNGVLGPKINAICQPLKVTAFPDHMNHTHTRARAHARTHTKASLFLCTHRVDSGY